jgi:two-component system sensor histidine kinase KdpD
MLTEALAARNRGRDLVVAAIGTGGQRELEELVASLESLQPRLLELGDLRLRELDLDALLSRGPEIAVVDGLGHRNPPGARHARRYEDVLELLEAGISVLATLHITELESVADSIGPGLGSPAEARVPDSLLDRADSLRLVDAPPALILERLSRGAIHPGRATKEELERLYSAANLAMLREITIRQVALFEERWILGALREDRSRPAAPARRLVVAVGGSPFGQGLIRWTRRLADALHAEWDCLTVEDGSRSSETERSRLRRSLELARDLGARIRTVASLDVAGAILRYARGIDASFLVIGKNAVLRRFWRPWRRGVSARILEESGDIPVFAVRERAETDEHGEAAPRGVRLVDGGLQYAIAALVILAVTGLNLRLADFVGYWGASLTYLAAVGLLALFQRRTPVLLAALASALLWNYLFIHPRFTFRIDSPSDLLMFALYVPLALALGGFMQRLRASEALLRQKEARLDALGSLAAQLAALHGHSEILEAARRALGDYFEAELVILIPDQDGRLSPEPGSWQALDAANLEAAAHCLRLGRATGRDSDTLPSAEWRFTPLEGPRGVLGVVGIRLAKGRAWRIQEEATLATMLQTTSLAYGRALLAEAAARNRVDRESERLGRLLLDSVSHELRTPLTVIQGTAMALQDNDALLGGKAREALLGEMVAAAARLDGIVDKLLSMSRIEAGMLRLDLRDVDPEELVTAALAQAGGELAGHPLRLDIAAGLPPLNCDEGLLVTVLVNLLRNAAQHGGEGVAISVAVAREGRSGLRFAVEDGGPGLVGLEPRDLFTKFRRGPTARPGGCGLGLAICKGLVEAHGGSIRAERGEAGGLRVSFQLPGKPGGGP